MIVAAAALLARDPDPGEESVKIALAGNLCRCTGYSAVFKALVAAKAPGGGS